MKALLPLLLGSLIQFPLCANAQGTITMANHGINPQGQAWSAPIYNTDGITPLTAPYEVAFYLGPSPSSVVFVPGSTTPIGGGLFSGPTITLPDQAISGVYVEVYAWNSTYGTTWDQAALHGSPIGETIFSINLGPASAPGTLYGMRSFSLSGGVPEPRTAPLMWLGGTLVFGAGMRRQPRLIV